ncbi:hypothetical protein PENSPDRAFT_654108 [Peniophora sp. CONT]|nr:hypothetical protein PENSPDRAFT_654108 [Peniophora sp. CONT]
MSIAGLNWDEAAYTNTSEDAWSAFIKSRFEVLASRKLNVGPTIQSRMLDLELSMLQKHGRIAHQYRNAFSGVAALPAEILATIFTFAQVGWQPNPRFRLTPKLDLGWVSVTHVCNSWRRAAISTPSLWTAISCSHLSLQMLPEFVHRARNSGLQLDYETWLCHKKLPIDVWLHDSILRRSRQISFSTVNKKQLVQAINLMKLSSPLPSLRGLTIHYEVEEDDWLPFEDGDFVSKSFPALRRLSLTNCFPRWSASSLPGRNLTHLSLSMSWYTIDLDDESFQPAAPLFRDMLVALPLLIELTLENFIPSPDFVIEPNGIHTPVILSERFVLPARLRKLTINIDTFCAYWSNYWYFWNNFQVDITTVVLVDLGIDYFDDRMNDMEDEGDWLVCFTCIDFPFVPALEMTLSKHCQHALHRKP